LCPVDFEPTLGLTVRYAREAELFSTVGRSSAPTYLAAAYARPHDGKLSFLEADWDIVSLAGHLAVRPQ